jgi:hypothetical protein
MSDDSLPMHPNAVTPAPTVHAPAPNPYWTETSTVTAEAGANVLVTAPCGCPDLCGETMHTVSCPLRRK